MSNEYKNFTAVINWVQKKLVTLSCLRLWHLVLNPQLLTLCVQIIILGYVQRKCPEIGGPFYELIFGVCFLIPGNRADKL